MGAIVLDARKVNSYVLPSLDKSKNTMQEAYSTGQSLRNTLPSTFRYRNSVNDIVTQIYNIRKEINDVDTIITKKVERATAIERKGSSNVSAIASKIGSIVGTIGGAAVGTSTGGIVGTVAGAVVGNQVGSAVGKALANTGAKIWNGATKIAKGIWNGIKKFGKAIWDGGAKIVNSAASWVKDKALPWVKNAASAVWDGIKWVGTQILKTAATIVNVVVSLVEGIVSFIEAIGDVVLLVAGVVCSIFTAISDVIQGIATGEWKWSATSAVWKKWIMPWVGYDWTSKAFAWQGDWIINDWAHEPFKRGETGAKIVKGVGYVVGVVVASIFTAGAAGAAGAASSGISGGVSAVSSLVTTGSSAVTSTVAMSVSSGIIAGSAKTAQSMQSGYNKLSDEEKQSGTALGKLGASSVLSGVVEGGTWALTAGTATTEMAGKTGVVSKIGGAFANKSTSTMAKAGLQATKAYATEGISVITDGEYDLKSATIDAAVSASTSILYDAGIKKGVDLLDEKITPPEVDDSAALEALDDVGTSSAIKDKFISTTGKIVHGANVVLKNKSTGKIVGKAVKDPIKKGMEGTVNFVEEKIISSAA